MIIKKTVNLVNNTNSDNKLVQNSTIGEIITNEEILSKTVNLPHGEYKFLNQRLLKLKIKGEWQTLLITEEKILTEEEKKKERQDYYKFLETR